MFSITDNERLRDAYALLMFMQRDISASAEKKAAVKNLAATVKMEIRAYNNRPVSNVRIISADYDGRLELVQLPDKLDEAHEMDATNWFLNHHYLKSYQQRRSHVPAISARSPRSARRQNTGWSRTHNPHTPWFTPPLRRPLRLPLRPLPCRTSWWALRPQRRARP